MLDRRPLVPSRSGLTGPRTGLGLLLEDDQAAPAHLHDVVVLDHKTIRLTGTGGTRRICSLHDPESQDPARRVLVDGTSEDLVDGPQGLIVFGRCRDDRPPLTDLSHLAPEYGYLVDGIEAGRGLTL